MGELSVVSHALVYFISKRRQYLIELLSGELEVFSEMEQLDVRSGKRQYNCISVV